MKHEAEQAGGRVSNAARSLKAAWLSLTRPRRLLGPPAWSWSMTWVVLAAVMAVLAAHPLDDSATLFVRTTHSPVINAMVKITDIGKAQWYLVPAAFLFLVIAFLDWDARARSGRSRLAFLFAQAGYSFLALILARIITAAAKFLVGRARPVLFDDGGSLHFQPFATSDEFNSFPSGHSTTMGVVAMVLMLLFPKARIPVFVLCAVGAATRIAARAHYPSDVVAGYAIGLLSALFLARWLARRRVAFRFGKDALLPVARFRIVRQDTSRND